MSVRKFIATASLVLIASVAAPTKASADWLFTPFVGWNWGGTANLLDLPRLQDEFEQKAMFGASLAWMGAGVIGFEVDFGYSPNFFQNTEGARRLRIRRQQPDHADGQPRDWRADRRTERSRGSVPTRSVALESSRAASVFDDDFFDDFDSTDFGFNVGAGAMFFFSDKVGVRGDVRYFRSLQDVEPIDDFNIGLSGFHFWRGTVGVTFRF